MGMIHLGMCFPVDGEAAAPTPCNPHGQFAEKSHLLLFITILSPPGVQLALFSSLSVTHTGSPSTLKLGSRCKPPIHTGKAEEHLVIPPTLLLRREPPAAIVCHICLSQRLSLLLTKATFYSFSVYKTQLHLLIRLGSSGKAQTRGCKTHWFYDTAPGSKYPERLHRKEQVAGELQHIRLFSSLL